ncbi:hypothetical protein [Brucella anthropi]|uniref:hypothetical protein n=1 Tax=Brucella anthropi TaxID=529 RepID=UPI003D996905
MPGNSREVVVKALEGLSSAPNILASKVINDLDDAGYRVVGYEELSEIIRDLVGLIEVGDKFHLDDMNPVVIRAKAPAEILAA